MISEWEQLLPEINSYSEQQFAEARRSSPAIDRYLTLVQKTPTNFSDELRIRRHRHWLKSALACFFQSAEPEPICKYWSHAAEELLSMTWDHCGLQNYEIGLFALGKLGSFELNLSSDVDLMVIGSSPKVDEVSTALKKFKRLLEQQTELGFALRVDFDLRPDGAWGPLLVSIPMFQNHYWGRGETWERLALVRMKDLAGSKEVRKEVMELRAKFCFRKFTDYTLQEDLKVLRSRIHSPSTAPSKDKINLKLTVGGIRDIELYIHSLQVIHGGRVPDIQVHSTSEATLRLSNNFSDKTKTLSWLIGEYWFLRDLENKVQIYSDQQTHELNRESPFPKLTTTAWDETQARMKKVDEVVSNLLGNVETNKSQLPNSIEAQARWLKDLGFSSHSIERIWPEIMKATALSHKKDRDEVIRQELLFCFVQLVADRGLRKDIALSFFLDFVRSARAKSTLFALLIREQKLLNLLAKLFSSSNYLSTLITTRPELIDGLVYGQQELSKSLEESLEILMERKQIGEIRSSLLFQDLKDPDTVSLHLTSTADQIATDLKQIVKEEVTGSDFKVFALGKWGTYELGFHSDLDFILVKNGKILPQDHKAAKRFISFLSSPQRGGKIYDIDLRLRPSGSSGPLLVSLDNFYEYLETKAQAWERQSYLKIRPLDQSIELDMSRIFQKGLSEEELQELRRIRSKLLKPTFEERQDIKYSPGGLVDMELCVQTAILFNKIPYLGSTSALCEVLQTELAPWKEKGAILREHYRFLRKVEQSYRLASQSSELQLVKGRQAFEDTAFLLDTSTNDLWIEVQKALKIGQQLVKELDPIYSSQ